MSDPLKKASDLIARKLQWTDDRGIEFIRQLIQSGDVYLTERVSHITVTENDYPKGKTFEIDAANLWCYEPFREAKELRLQMGTALNGLRAANQELEHDWGGDHSDPEACPKCIIERTLHDLGEDI